MELEGKLAKRQWIRVKNNGDIEPLFYISKDKIREKIEELNKEYSKYTGYKGLEFSRTGLINSQIKVLKKLLEEINEKL